MDSYPSGEVIILFIVNYKWIGGNHFMYSKQLAFEIIIGNLNKNNYFNSGSNTLNNSILINVILTYLRNMDITMVKKWKK